MDLNRTISIDYLQPSSGRFKSFFLMAQREFEHYSFEYKEPYNFWESVPNPDYDPEYIRSNEHILEPRVGDFGFDLHLKNANHISFDIKCFSYNGKIYIYPGVYHFANFNADNLKELALSFVLRDNFMLANSLSYNKKSYKQWIDERSDQKWAQHNYKMDQEDLAKIGIFV